VPPTFETSLPPPAARRHLPLAAHVTALGLPFANGPPPPDVVAAAWTGLLARVEAVFAKVSRLGLSVFGRGFASAAYGVPKLLYHAEFLGHPPPAVATRLQQITAKLVDRGLAPAATTKLFPGLHHELLFGRPASGGFGAMPWELHISARHARWAARLLTSPSSPSSPAGAAAVPLPLVPPLAVAPPPPSHSPPWVAIACELLHGLPPAGLLYWPISAPIPGSLAALPPPLLRLRAALASLPAPTDVAVAPLVPGPWCLSLPLWGNPLLLSPAYPAGIDSPFTDFLAAGVHCLRSLLAVEAAARAAPTQQAYAATVLPTLLRSSYAFSQRYVVLERIALLLAALPPAWVAAARAAAGLGLLPSPKAVMATILLPRLGWRLGAARPIPLANLTVRAATALLAAPAAAHRAATRLAPFAAAAAGALSPAAAPLPELLSTLERLWRLPWENGRKEAFWRLVYDALPTAARMHRDAPCLCGSSGPRPDRHHHFWACPVACAVVAAIHAALTAASPALPPPPPLLPSAIWLARTPPGIHAGPWGVVCLAAVEAMDRGRRSLASEMIRRHQAAAAPAPPAGPHYTQLTLDSFLQQPGPQPGVGAASTGDGTQDPPPPPLQPAALAPPAAPAAALPPPTPVEAATRLALQSFWSLLSDFDVLGCAPASWAASLGPAHPFFFTDDGRIRLRPPPLPP
jgi:hypothetical protein